MPATPHPPASPNTPGPGRPTGRKGEITAERILDEAEALFAERGYAGTTLRDVAARVGVRNPSLYNHFESKEALYRAVLGRGVGPVLLALSSFVEATPESRPSSDTVLRQMMAILGAHPNLPRLVQHEALTGGQHLTPILREWIAPIFDRSNEFVTTGPGAGRWRPEHVPHLVLAIYNIVVGYFATAPLYGELRGVDLLAPETLAVQTDFLCKVVDALLPPTS